MSPGSSDILGIRFADGDFKKTIQATKHTSKLAKAADWITRPDVNTLTKSLNTHVESHVSSIQPGESH